MNLSGSYTYLLDGEKADAHDERPRRWARPTARRG